MRFARIVAFCSAVIVKQPSNRELLGVFVKPPSSDNTFIDLKNGEKVILVLLPLKKHIVCSGTENTHGNQPKHEII